MSERTGFQQKGLTSWRNHYLQNISPAIPSFFSNPRLKVLDLFCGRGGWSKGFHSQGFDCLGIDIVNVGYPYDLILQDIRTVDGSQFKDFEVIVGSPPCRDFTYMTAFGWKKWKDPPNPQRGFELVAHFLRIVREAEPKIWLMENVPKLCRYLLEPKPRVIRAKLSKTMIRNFWGEFPLFLIPMDSTKKLMTKFHNHKTRSILRAEIPFCVSHAFAKTSKKFLIGEFSHKDN